MPWTEIGILFAGFLVGGTIAMMTVEAERGELRSADEPEAESVDLDALLDNALFDVLEAAQELSFCEHCGTEVSLQDHELAERSGLAVYIAHVECPECEEAFAWSLLPGYMAALATKQFLDHSDMAQDVIDLSKQGPEAV